MPFSSVACRCAGLAQSCIFTIFHEAKVNRPNRIGGSAKCAEVIAMANTKDDADRLPQSWA
jgi:hypothetical protein